MLTIRREDKDEKSKKIVINLSASTSNTNGKKAAPPISANVAADLLDKLRK